MDIANLETEEENNCLISKIKKAGKSKEAVFIGLSKLGQPSYKLWTSGKEINYSNWGTSGGTPDFLNPHCGIMKGGKWLKSTCGVAYIYACESPKPPECGPYFYSTDTKPFDTAKAECKKRGMTMAVPDTLHKNACIQRHLFAAGLSGVLFLNGLDKRGETNYTKWTNGAPLTYTEWGPGQPAAFSTEDCGIFLDRHWSDASCTYPGRYICENITVESPCSGLTANYSVSSAKLSWGAARAECERLGMDLANIETEKEHLCVKEKIEFAGKVNELVFQFLNKIGQPSYSQWSSGEAVTFTDWKTGQPGAPSTKHCVGYLNGQWSESLCATTSQYVCESPQPKDVCSAYNFFISTVKKNYADARMECLVKKMSLASLESSQENLCLGQAIAEIGKSGDPVWMGLDKKGKANYTDWLNGAPLNYTDWDLMNPKDFATEHCAVHLNHHWYDSACDVLSYFACEPAFKDPCAGFTQNYSVSTTKKTWAQARAECKKVSGDLAALETPEESECVKLVIYSAGKNNEAVWHSLNKLGELYFAHWANGESLTYNKFPSTYKMTTFTAQHCAAFENEVWNDFDCGTALQYVCEFNPAPKEICKDGQHVLFKEKITFTNAQASCKAKGMALVDAETPVENFCIQSYLLSLDVFTAYVWGGLTKKGSTNYTKWSNGAALTYWDFPPGALGNGAEECIIFLTGHWADWACAYTSWYVCETL